MSEPRVTRIHVEYSDGSFDDVELLSEDTAPLYDLRRKGHNIRKGRLGLHTSGAIGALLFQTAFTGKRREYSPFDPDVIKLLSRYCDDSTGC